MVSKVSKLPTLHTNLVQGYFTPSTQVIFLLSMCQVRAILIYFSHSFSIFLNRTSTCFLPYSIISLTFQFPKFSKVIGPQISFFKLIIFINLLYAFCCFSIILSFFGFQIDKFLLNFHSFIIFKIANHDKIKFVIQQTKCIWFLWQSF